MIIEPRKLSRITVPTTMAPLRRQNTGMSMSTVGLSPLSPVTSTTPLSPATIEGKLYTLFFPPLPLHLHNLLLIFSFSFFPPKCLTSTFLEHLDTTKSPSISTTTKTKKSRRCAHLSTARALLLALALIVLGICITVIVRLFVDMERVGEVLRGSKGQERRT